MTAYLLDTHVFLWLQTEPARLFEHVRDELTRPDSTRLLSVASAWEIALKHRLGKLPLPEPPATYVPSRMRMSVTTPLAVQLEHALHVDTLPPIHSDPFDRLIVAQAQLLGCTVITADDKIVKYDIDAVSV